MTVFYPDISSFQAGIGLSGAHAACCKATQGTGYTNPDYARAKTDAASHGTFFFAYHFLTAGSAAAQALHCHSVTGSTPLMIDAEPDAGSQPSLADVTAFADAYRKAGGTCWLVYLPHWYWQQMGSPSLKPLADRGLLLVSSAYTPYTDESSGAGWQSYGGMTPVIWQYTDSLNFSGYSVDFNAYRGTHPGDQSPAAIADTLRELKSVVTTGRLPGAPVTITVPEDDMILNLIPGGATALAVPSGKTHLLLSADEFGGHTPPQLRVGYGPHWDGEHKVTVTWNTSPLPLAMPPGTTHVTIARLDADTVPVSVAWA